MSMKLGFELGWRLGESNGETLDPLVFRLLAGIRDAGSLRAAAINTGVSYRHAWGMLTRLEKLFGRPLALLSRGRGAELTDLGWKLLWARNRVLTRLGPELESLASEIGSEIDRLLQAEAPPPLRIFASHGLALGILRQLAAEQQRLKLDLQFRGSLESLRLLKNRRCDLAGFHIAAGEVGRQLWPRFQPWLQSRQQILIHVVTRSQGLMLARGNPKRIRNLRELARPDVGIVNRQPGSGTRLLFDQLLDNAGIAAKDINGYETEEFTHLAVAALVASGSADAGFGIAAAAAEMDLDFIPLVTENYYFCLPVSLVNTRPIEVLLALLRSREFRDRVNRLRGYDADQAGRPVRIEQLFDDG